MSDGPKVALAPGTCQAGRLPSGWIGRIVQLVWTSLRRARARVSTAWRARAISTKSPGRSSPIAPIAITLAPSRARSTAVPPAVPAAVARISSSRLPDWPTGSSLTGRPSTSMM